MKNISFVAAGAIARQISAGIALWILTVQLGAESYGRWITLLAFVTSAATLGGNGFSVYLIQQGTRSHAANGKLGRIYPTSLGLALLTGCIAIPLLLTFGDTGEQHQHATAIVVVTLTTILSHFGRYGLQAVEEFRQYGALFAADRAIFAALAILLSLTNRLTFETVCIAHVAAMLVPTLFAMNILLKKKFSSTIADFNITDFTRVTIPNLLAVQVNFILSQGFILIVLIRLGLQAASIGQIGLAFRIIGLCQQPVRWVTPTVFPALERARSNKGEGAVVKIVETKIIPIAWAFSALYVLIIPLTLCTPLIPAIFSNEYDEASTWIALTFGSLGGQVMNSFLVKALWSLKKDRHVLISSAIGAVVPLIAALYCKSPEEIVLALTAGIWIRTLAQTWLIGVRRIDRISDVIFATVLCSIYPIIFIADVDQSVKTLLIIIVITSCLLRAYSIRQDIAAALSRTKPRTTDQPARIEL